MRCFGICTAVVVLLVTAGVAGGVAAGVSVANAVATKAELKKLQDLQGDLVKRRNVTCDEMTALMGKVYRTQVAVGDNLNQAKLFDTYTYTNKTTGKKTTVNVTESMRAQVQKMTAKVKSLATKKNGIFDKLKAATASACQSDVITGGALAINIKSLKEEVKNAWKQAAMEFLSLALSIVGAFFTVKELNLKEKFFVYLPKQVAEDGLKISLAGFGFLSILKTMAKTESYINENQDDMDNYLERANLCETPTGGQRRCVKWSDKDATLENDAKKKEFDAWGGITKWLSKMWPTFLEILAKAGMIAVLLAIGNPVVSAAYSAVMSLWDMGKNILQFIRARKRNAALVARSKMDVKLSGLGTRYQTCMIKRSILAAQTDQQLLVRDVLTKLEGAGGEGAVQAEADLREQTGAVVPATDKPDNPEEAMEKMKEAESQLLQANEMVKKDLCTNCPLHGREVPSNETHLGFGLYKSSHTFPLLERAVGFGLTACYHFKKVKCGNKNVSLMDYFGIAEYADVHKDRALWTGGHSVGSQGDFTDMLKKEKLAIAGTVKGQDSKEISYTDFAFGQGKTKTRARLCTEFGLQCEDDGLRADAAGWLFNIAKESHCNFRAFFPLEFTAKDCESPSLAFNNDTGAIVESCGPLSVNRGHIVGAMALPIKIQQYIFEVVWWTDDGINSAGTHASEPYSNPLGADITKADEKGWNLLPAQWSRSATELKALTGTTVDDPGANMGVRFRLWGQPNDEMPMYAEDRMGDIKEVTAANIEGKMTQSDYARLCGA